MHSYLIERNTNGKLSTWVAVLCPTAAVGNGFASCFSHPFFCSNIISGSTAPSTCQLLLTLPALPLILTPTLYLASSNSQPDFWLLRHHLQEPHPNSGSPGRFHSHQPHPHGPNCQRQGMTCITPEAGQIRIQQRQSKSTLSWKRLQRSLGQSTICQLFLPV